MRIISRLIIALVGVVTLVAFLFTYINVEKEKSRLYGEMDHRAQMLGATMVESVQDPLIANSKSRLNRVVAKFGNRRLLRGFAVYNKKETLLAASDPIKSALEGITPQVQTTIRYAAPQTDIQKVGSVKTHVYVLPIFNREKTVGALAVLHDTSFIQRQIDDIWRSGFFNFLILTLLLVVTTFFVTQVTFLGPLRRAAAWVKGLRVNADTIDWSEAPQKDLFGPLAREVRFLAQSLSEARAAAEEEAKLRQASESQWTPDRLKEHVKTTLGNRPLFVVANREPYVHTMVGKQIRAIVPASGLVTALEPILKACGGTWVGHGAGEADRETVDDQDHVRVPPDDPLYTLRRVWMSKEEENGYYYGFSNEGLWPLCHIAHTRPVFRPKDWEYYKKINQKFADAVLEELKGTEEPCVLIQDYHFALLPKMIKERRPDARVALFWHIPWPNPESFGICPWQKQILEGMLGADLLGFHIQYHCNNFLETVDRAVESRIDWAQFSVSREGHRTIVKPFPISVAVTQNPDLTSEESPSKIKEQVLQDLGIEATHLGVGVDRIDYTKGIIERFHAIERFLEKYPKYQGNFSFVEIGAPSRTLIQTYHELDAEIEVEANRINWKFKTKDWKPIILLKKHHTHEEIERFYKSSSLCMVTSLHDGMNLVAKEYINSKEDRQGVLILSRFAGAAQEFRDALIVNPYDIDQMADAIYVGLEMDQQEQRKRMGRMQDIVRENNVYRWGAELITELAQIRIDSKANKKVTA